MTYDLTQWLTEIRTLQRQLSAAQQERDQAYASAANWRRLYEKEAQQRRTEVQALRDQIAEWQAYPQPSLSPSELSLATPDREGHANHQGNSNYQSLDAPIPDSPIPDIQDVTVLQSKLTEALQRCHELAQTLTNEKAAHEQTRNNLTAALSDTIDVLAREKQTKPAALQPMRDRQES